MDKFLTQCVQNTELQEEFHIQMSLIKQRQKILGSSLYKQVLSGRVLSTKQLQKVCKNQDIDVCTAMLGITNQIDVYLPQEYQDKITF